MTHFCILRALGLILICALVINIAIVLAAPFYLASKPPRTVAAATRHVSVENATRPAAPVVPQEPSEAANIAPEADTTADESGGPQQLAAESPSVTWSQDPTISKRPHFMTLKQSSEQLLYSLGAGLGSNSSNLHRHVVIAAKHFARTTGPVAREQGSDEQGGVINDDTVAEDSNVARIVLTNPSENNLSVSFMMNGSVQTLAPGAELIQVGSEVLIRFDRGGELGEFKKQLPPGRYEFHVSRSGWALEAVVKNR